MLRRALVLCCALCAAAPASASASSSALNRAFAQLRAAPQLRADMRDGVTRVVVERRLDRGQRILTFYQGQLIREAFVLWDRAPAAGDLGQVTGYYTREIAFGSTCFEHYPTATPWLPDLDPFWLLMTPAERQVRGTLASAHVRVAKPQGAYRRVTVRRRIGTATATGFLRLRRTSWRPAYILTQSRQGDLQGKRTTRLSYVVEADISAPQNLCSS